MVAAVTTGLVCVGVGVTVAVGARGFRKLARGGIAGGVAAAFVVCGVVQLVTYPARALLGRVKPGEGPLLRIPMPGGS